MIKPTLSCVIPAYNAEAFIRSALDSVAQQTVPCDQIIVVDDASSDRTVEVIRTWAKGELFEIGDNDMMREDQASRHGFNKANRILVRRTRNEGPAAARNIGIGLAHGEWIAFLDGDDTWLPHKIETQLCYHEAFPHVDLWCGGITRTAPGIAPGETQRTLGERVLDWRRITLEELAWHNPVSTSTVVVRKAVLDSTGGFDVRFKGPEDYDLWMRMAATFTLGIIKEEVSYYRVSTDSLSMDDRTFLPQILKVLDKAYGPGGVLHEKHNGRKARAWQMLSGAWMANERLAYGDAWSWMFRSLIQWPGPFSGPVCKKWARLKLANYLLRQMMMRHPRHSNPMKENHG